MCAEVGDNPVGDKFAASTSTVCPVSGSSGNCWTNLQQYALDMSMDARNRCYKSISSYIQLVTTAVHLSSSLEGKVLFIWTESKQINP